MAYTKSQAQAGRGSTLSVGANLSITGDTTSASTSVTSVSSTAGISVGMPISGAGIPAGTTVASIGTGTLTLSQAATATATAVALTVDAAQLIGEIKTANMNAGKWETADVTNFESGADREFITTLRDNGTVDVSGNRVAGDAGQQAIESAYGSGALQAFTLALPKTSTQSVQGDTYTFSALVLSRDFSVDVAKEIDWKLSLKISGAVTYAAGS